MDTRTTDELMTDLAQRAAAAAVEQIKGEQGEPINEAKVREWVGAWAAELKEDDPLVRKIRFAAPEPEVVGTKFSRWGLTTADIEWLYDVQVGTEGRARKGGGVYRGASEELSNAFKAVSDAIYLSEEEIKRIDRQAIDELFPRVPKNPKQTRHNMQMREHHYRAMDTAEAGFGAELIGAQYVGDLWEASRPESRVDSLISTFEMTAAIAYLPVEAGLPRMKLVGEATTSTPTAFTSVKTPSNRVSVTAKKFALRQLWSGELEEDSIIPFVPYLRRQAAMGLAHDADALVLNGDDTNAATGNINSDDDDPPDDSYYLAFDGLRHAFLVDNTANGINVAGVVSLDVFRDLRSRMLDASRIMDWGHPNTREDLVFVCDPDTADRVELLDEVIEWKKINQNIPILAGESGRVLGHPVLSSIDLSKTEADGKLSFDTPANNVKGQIVAFNRRGCVTGWLRRIRVETDRDISTDQNEIVYTLRRGFGRFTPTGAASGIEWCSGAYNLFV